jgi:glycosyltransferase involved in cell wall biosynthesis
MSTHFQPEQRVQFSEAPDPGNPGVSVIIPNYNHTRFVTDAIQSVLNQTYRSYEIIVVDDGSTDNSREVVAGFGSQVRYIWQENQGLAGARNTGIRAARGELIGLLDADDQWLPEFLEKMVALADEYPEAVVYYCSAQGMDTDGHDLPQVFGGPAVPPKLIYQLLLRANFLIPSTVVLRRSTVLAAGLFDQALRSCEDWDLWLRLLPERTFVGTSHCLVRYRLHGSSLSGNLSGMHQAAQATIKKNFGTDDGQESSWSPEKRRAYGGLYRYFALTSVQRQNDWHASASYLHRALQTDPTLAGDLDLFYDLARGSQPPGYRDSSAHLNLKDNASQISHMLAGLFASSSSSDLGRLRRQTYGTAYFALGLVAYNTNQLSLSRRFLVRALYFRPELWRDPRVSANLVKSFFGRSVLVRMKRDREQADSLRRERRHLVGGDHGKPWSLM